MQCQTFSHINEETGEKVMKPKKAFDTLDEAIATCKKLNMRPHRISKLVSYKCRKCHKYHIGRNGKEITDKYRDKHTIKAKDKLKGFKVIGKIDLSKIPK